MKEKCLVDTTVILKIIFEGNANLLDELLNKFEVCIPVNVLEEAMFKITIETLREIYGDRGFYSLKTLFEKNEVPQVLVKRLQALNLLADLVDVIAVTKEDYKIAKTLSLRYKLFSNDSLIIAIALRSGITKMATFDSDFESVGNLNEILNGVYY